MIRPPFLTTNFSESGKKAKARFENILSGRKKRGVLVLVLVLILTAAVGGAVACRESGDNTSSAIIGGADGPTAIYIGTDEITQAILDANKRRYLSEYDETEFSSAGYVVLGEEEKDGERIIYALVTYGEYQFLNGNFVKNAGSGTMATVITLDKDNELISYTEPGPKPDRETVKEMFPEEYVDRIFDSKQRQLDYEACKKMEQDRAREYLKIIGREDATVGEYGDFDYEFIEDANMDVSASNHLFLVYRDYPQYIGTIERIEDGVRFVYEKKWEPEEQIISYIKTEYESGEIAEEIVISVKSGEIVTLKNYNIKEENHG